MEEYFNKRFLIQEINRIKNSNSWRITKPFRIIRDFFIGKDKNDLKDYLFHAKRLEKFKDIHKGEDCFIVCNGPSLNKIDLNKLNSKYVFGLNKIFSIFDRVNLNLDYHVCVNKHVIEQSKREIKDIISCPSFLSYFKAKEVISPSKNIYYILTGGDNIVPFSFQKNFSEGVHEGYTVTFVALQLAYYMGFRRVFFVGLDHNYKFEGNPNETIKWEGDDTNHFDKNYFKDRLWQPPDLVASELAFHLAKFYYERDGRKIYNATPGTKLDIFPKISYKKALELCKEKNEK